MMPLYALNLFDLADNDLYRRYPRRSTEAGGKHGGKDVSLEEALGKHRHAGHVRYGTLAACKGSRGLG